MSKNSCEKLPKCLENKVSQKMCSKIDILFEILYNGLIIKLWAHPIRLSTAVQSFFSHERFIVSNLDSKEPRYLVSDIKWIRILKVHLFDGQAAWVFIIRFQDYQMAVF